MGILFRHSYIYVDIIRPTEKEISTSLLHVFPKVFQQENESIFLSFLTFIGMKGY